MTGAFELVLARGKIHLTPGEINALWHLTRWIGQQFWHLGTWAQVALAGLPGMGASVWLWRWDPLVARKK